MPDALSSCEMQEAKLSGPASRLASSTCFGTLSPASLRSFGMLFLLLMKFFMKFMMFFMAFFMKT
jgi:hypothetical protein